MTEARPGAAPAPPSHWQGLRQRFDTLALRPPDTSPVASPNDPALARRDLACRAALLAWCRQDAGPGGTLFWRPGALPRVGLRLAVAALRGAGHGSTVAWVEQLAQQLDGSLHLAALPGRSAGLAYRLGVKRHDAMWWRQRQAHDPWDAGWALSTPAALQQLQTAFWPRRATLLLADLQAVDRLAPCLAALGRRQAGFRHPVRWLWVAGMAEWPALPAGPGPPDRCFTLV
jgi:hypothetical protein